MKADSLQLGDFVLIDGIPRKVEAITKKKIGYHKNKQTDQKLHYARLVDVKPIEVTEIYIRDESNVVLNRRYLVSGEMWAAGKNDKINVDFQEGDLSFYTPFYLHDFYNIVRAMCDRKATLEFLSKGVILE